MATVFLGLRTVIYPAPDLAAARSWFAGVLGVEPYFDQPFYVGFDVAGYELGLLPDAAVDRGPVTYWGVPDVDVSVAQLVEAGATVDEPVADVGDGIRTATVQLPHHGGVLGVIENPHFRLSEQPAPVDGSGR